jgi:hypothetical protein
MAENFSETSLAKTNSFEKGMLKDVADIYMTEGVWTNAINAINNSHTGESGTLGNEPSNKECASATFDIIGFVNKKGTEWILFSTDDVNSEIGIFEETSCTYTRVINDTCLGFKKTNLITAVIKENYDCTWSVYWQDGLNPDRVMNIDNIPYLCVASDPEDPCEGEDCSTRLDCDAIRLHPKIKQPCIISRRADGAGQLTNGSYMAVIAYSENGVRLTDYSLPSNPQSFWSHEGIGGSINITLADLDQNFNEFELVIIATVAQQAIAKKIGYYSINQTQVVLDQILQSLPTVELPIIPLKNVIYEKSDKMFNINEYLIRSGVTSQPHINYQPLANLIQAEWMSVKYPRDYYFYGGNKVGYMRDEVYAFFIRWVYDTGARSASYHIPGRPANGNDLTSVTGSDIVYSNETKKWQVYDTSTINNDGGTTDDGGVIVNSGQMSYWESTERYPVQPEVWNDLCNEPIRHHKMPSNETTHIHDITGDYIYVLGVRFKNVRHPLDENGVPISNIVGYEILRGSREGHRSIVTKGMFNNMCEYYIQGNSSKLGLYQNYPYNDLNDDYFLTNNIASIDSGSGTPDLLSGTPNPIFTGVTGYVGPLIDPAKNNIFSFHSPEIHITKPYLGSNYIKLYTEEIATVKGEFQLPYKHPKFKFVTDGTFLLGIVIAAGLSILDGLGQTTQNGTVSPAAATVALGSASGIRSAGYASAIPDFIAATTIQLASPASTINAFTLIGIGLWLGEQVYWGAKTVNEVMNIVKNLSKYRNHALQYNSHGFYSGYRALTNAPVSLSYLARPTIRRKVSENLIRYIGSGIQSFSTTHRINNLYRNKYVCLQTDLTVPFAGASTSSGGTNIYEEKTRLRVRDVSDISHKNPFGEFTSQAISYYGAIKVDYQNQYGQLERIMQMPIGSCVVLTQPSLTDTFSTGVMFGGDVYINRYTEKNPYFFFNTWMIDFPNGTEFDYRNYVNGPYPRYWMNTADFDASEFAITFDPTAVTDTTGSTPLIDLNTPSDGHRFDRPSLSAGFIIKNAWMYVFYNGVRDFFTESELNMAFRDYGDRDKDKFYDVYGRSFNDLQYMFRSDVITEPTYYRYDLSLSASKLFSNFGSWGSLLPRDYDPTTYDKCFEYYPRRTVYSLQQQEGLKRDNWRNYLPLNYKDFRGKVSTIKALNLTGAVILFEDAEPILFDGIDQLQTQNGVKFTIGDGGLFDQNGRTLVNSDDVMEYGTSISSRSAINTPFGMYFISQKNGKIFSYASGTLEDIGRAGMKFWLNMNLPSTLLKSYPNYPLYDNPVAGIGCQTVYDPTYELIYFTKKDYTPVRDDLQFDDPIGVPYFVCGISEVPAPTEIPEIVNNVGDCGCPEGYTFIEGECSITETEPATLVGGSTINLVQGATVSFFGIGGLRVNSDITSYVYTGTPSYANYINCVRAKGLGRFSCSTPVNYVANFTVRDSNGTGALIPLAYTPSNLPTYSTPYSPSGTNYMPYFWRNRLNDVKISLDGEDLDSEVPLELVYCVTITEEKQYLIGCAADDQFKLYLNLNNAGEQLVIAMNAFCNGVDLSNISCGAGDGYISNQSVDTGVYNFWHIYPITLPAGTHKLKIVGENSNGAFGLGTEIYDISLTSFITQFVTDLAATSTDLEPYILFSTKDYQGESVMNPNDPGVYTCPDEGTVDYCGNPTCVVTTTVPYAPCLDCNLTASSLSVSEGSSVLLTWNSSGGTTVTLNDDAVSNNGVLTVFPTTNPTYYVLKVVNGDFIKTCYLEVEVTPIPIKCYCNYDDPNCFKKCDWTLSYDPKMKMFVSFHDWHPNLLMPSADHFYTIVDNTIWKHNDRYDSYCNYYGENYPWEVEYPIVTPNNVTTLKNVEYYMEAYRFYNNGKDYFHILDENFDRAIVYNSEQISGLLKLNLKGKNAPLDLINYPQPGLNGSEILYAKEENKYRFDQFYDITDDRGEYSGSSLPMWNTDCSGYQKYINPAYVLWNKPATEHKKFRHYGNKIILRKNISNDVKMILKLTNSKHLVSPR